MDDKGRVFQKLDKDELKEVSGGYVYCKENAPKVICPVCFGKSTNPLKPNLVEMTYDGCYFVVTGESGYCYKCPECNYYLQMPYKGDD